MDEKHKTTIVVLSSGASGLRAIVGDEVAEIKIPLTLPPTMVGKHGRAWRCDIAEGLRLAVAQGVLASPAHDATVAKWVVEAPWAHPVWHSYALTVIHLRPIEPVPRNNEIIFYKPNATHELWLAALNPEVDLNEVAATGLDRKGASMLPLNFAAQFVEVTDDLARERVHGSVRAILDGTLNPDTDAISQWVALYGDNMMKVR